MDFNPGEKVHAPTINSESYILLGYVDDNFVKLETLNKQEVVLPLSVVQSDFRKLLKD
jgi:hypothetical protein